MKITLEIPKGIHIQAHQPTEELLIPTKISLKETKDISIGKPVYPKPEKLTTSWSQITLLVYEGKIDILVPVQIAKEAKLGKREVEGVISFQGCTNSFCLPPRKQRFVLRLEVL